MARFPKAEAEIVALAEAMETGLAANAERNEQRATKEKIKVK